MRTFRYDEPVYIGHGDYINNEVTVTEEEIIKTYFPYWEAQMRMKGELTYDLISKEHCIEDFCTVHYARELKED